MPTDLQFPTTIDLDEFISKEAHDLKSPFNRILGFTKLVLKGMDGPISDLAREDLTTAYQNSQYALVMISGLIEMARLSRGERHASLVDIPADTLLQQTIVEWKKISPKEKLVEMDIQASSRTVKADEVLMRQALVNWIFYVAEFVQEAVQVSIQVEELPKACKFTIRSTGKKLQPPPGCDLTIYGYIASQILKLQHGEMLCAQEDEQGASVQFILPTA